VGVILVGNLVTLVPMILNAHAGTKYGIPFPVLLRTSYGHKGAHFPAVLRALVACGWFGIQTWIGGGALHTMTHALVPDLWANDFSHTIFRYLVFWGINLYFVRNGTESILALESYAAPCSWASEYCFWVGASPTEGGPCDTESFLRPVSSGAVGELGSREYGLGKAPGEAPIHVLNDLRGEPKARSMILGEVVTQADGTQQELPLTGGIPYASDYTGCTAQTQLWARFDSELQDRDKRTSWLVPVQVDAPEAPAHNKLLTYLMAITAMVAFWVTLALNIPDITRFARSQWDQALGQAIGLPLAMGLYSFIGPG
jgi:hypothetical protein